MPRSAAVESSPPSSGTPSPAAGITCTSSAPTLRRGSTRQLPTSPCTSSRARCTRCFPAASTRSRWRLEARRAGQRAARSTSLHVHYAIPHATSARTSPNRCSPAALAPRARHHAAWHRRAHPGSRPRAAARAASFDLHERRRHGADAILEATRSLRVFGELGPSKTSRSSATSSTPSASVHRG